MENSKNEETLEEVLKNELEFIHNSCRNFDFDLGFKTGGLIGTKWQQEQDKKLYRDEEVLQILQNIFSVYGKHIDVVFNEDLIKDLFEQYKK